MHQVQTIRFVDQPHGSITLVHIKFVSGNRVGSDPNFKDTNTDTYSFPKQRDFVFAMG